ncbi:hypothetical protein GCM10009544_04630 [Streptomyces stramineus]|uniref:Uncharacterized protein n=1 Tax=Streptomyces stramineus TaxID=173861 RepID=A0ABN0ZEP0_9ACTN
MNLPMILSFLMKHTYGYGQLGAAAAGAEEAAAAGAGPRAVASPTAAVMHSTEARAERDLRMESPSAACRAPGRKTGCRKGAATRKTVMIMTMQV